MIGHHVTERSRHIKIAATFFHAHGFRHRYLYVVNVAAVPDGLKNAIAEAENKNVLYRFFAKVVVDAENLLFGQHFADLAVQRFGRFQIITERLFKDHSPPMTIFFTGQFRSAEALNDVAKECWAGGKIKKVIALGVARLVDLRQGLPNSGVELRIMKFTANVKDPLDHPIAEFGINLTRRKL